MNAKDYDDQAKADTVTASLEGRAMQQIRQYGTTLYDEYGNVIMRCQSPRHAELQRMVFKQALSEAQRERADLMKAKMEAEMTMQHRVHLDKKSVSDLVNKWSEAELRKMYRL